MKTVAQTFILTILTVFGLTSCDNKTQTKTDKPSTTADLTKSTINTGQSITIADSTLKTTTNQEINQDTIQFDYVYYPSDTTKFIAKLRMTGRIRGHWDKLDTGKWFGFFIREGRDCYLAESKLKMRSAKTRYGMEFYIETIDNDNPVILVQGLDFLNIGKIQQVYPPLNHLARVNPDDTLKFDFWGIDYKIYATVDTIKGYANKMYYRLFLEALKDGQLFTELIAAKPTDINNMSGHIFIVFAGDIDADGFVDLIIEMAGEKKCDLGMTLYLSKLADNGHLLKVVGRCCYQAGC